MRHLPFLVLNTFLFASAYSQSTKGTVSFQLGFPQGEYKKTYPITSTGLLFGVTHRLQKSSPFSLGGELGVLQVSGKSTNYTGTYNNEYNTFLVSSWNHIVTLATLIRADLLNNDKSWNFYVNVSLGANWFVTTASISRDLPNDPITGMGSVNYYYKNHQSHFAFRGGAGLGTEVPLGRKKKISLVLKTSYLFGSHVKYYTAPVIDNTQIILNPRESRTSMLLAEAGIMFGMFQKKSR